MTLVQVDSLAPLRPAYERSVLQAIQQHPFRYDIPNDIAATSWEWALAGLYGWLARDRNPGAWVGTIARHAVRTYVESGADGFVLSNDLAARVPRLRRAVGAITVDQRECLLLRLSGRLLKDTALAMGRSESSVKALELRGEQRVRLLLGENQS